MLEEQKKAVIRLLFRIPRNTAPKVLVVLDKMSKSLWFWKDMRKKKNRMFEHYENIKL